MLIGGNIKWGSITVPLTSCLTGLDWSVLQIKTTIVSCHTTDSKPVKQEVNGTVTLPPLVFPGSTVLVVRDDEKTLHNFDDRSLVGILNSLTSASTSNDEKSKLFALSSQTGSLEYPGANVFSLLRRRRVGKNQGTLTEGDSSVRLTS